MNFEAFSFILERLTDYMENKFTVLSTDTKTALDSLRKELQMMESFFMYVDEIERRGSLSPVLRTQLQHLGEISLEIEDLLDGFCKEADERSHGSVLKKLKAFACGSNPLMRTHRMIERIEELKNKLRDTMDRPNGYQLPSNFPQVTQRLRPQTYPYLTDNHFIIGLEDDIKTLVAKLVGKESDLTTTLAIVGMGGSGKTTLARTLYNHKDIMGHFVNRAWVCVSQDWDISCLVSEICLQVGVRLPKHEMSIPSIKLQEFLRNNSCFVVLDNVWKIETLQQLLPILLSVGRTGSSIVLITTRNEEIVKFPSLGGFYVHKARRLTPEESWKLFSTIVCRNWQGICSLKDEDGFTRLGMDMLEKCNGLPLAVVALAGFLSTKGSIQEWESIKNDVISMIMKHNRGFHDYGAVKEMLELSYYDLPYYLKPCFLYLGIFQENRDISIDDLTQLWIAEGFVKSNLCNQSGTPEELAVEFLDELIQRYMVQVVSKDGEEKVGAIRIHDLMRELCIQKANELDFFEISSSSSLPSTTLRTMSRRAIIHKGNFFPRYNANLRSLICFQDHGATITKLELPYEKLRLLRILHLVKVHLGDLGEQIGNMVLLKYLRIERCFGTEKLLQYIGKLRSLLTFIYCGSDESVFTNILGSMEHLRHLSLSCNTNARPVLGVGMSKNLQVLKVRAGEWLAKELPTVSMGLRDLKVTNIGNQAQMEVIYDFVSSPYSSLRTLHLSLGSDPALEFDLHKFKFECCRLLKNLFLRGNIRKKPSSLLFPPNLLSLELRFSRIDDEEDMKRALAQLGQLRSLALCEEAYKANRLTIMGLPQLQVLKLENLSKLKEWRIEEGAIPQLKMLLMLHCYQLERIPKGISYIHTLQCFRANIMSNSFCKRLQPPSRKEDRRGAGGAGEDFHLIQHIPFIEITKMFPFFKLKRNSI